MASGSPYNKSQSNSLKNPTTTGENHPVIQPRAAMVLMGRYELVTNLAAGGMAQVWKGRDLLLGRNVAVKILHPHMTSDSAFVARFRREAVAAAGLSHPSIVAIYDTISQPGLEAIVMELIEGRTLRAVVDEAQVLPAETVVNIGTQIAMALAAAHDAGIIHRDIKPANIMISKDNRVMVTDFGIAKASKDADLTNDGTLLGTAKYLSPEQLEGSAVDHRSDIYSLGVVLFECLTGRPPFDEGSDAATALARIQREPPHCHAYRPTVPLELDQIVHQAMARSAHSRYSNAFELANALTKADLRVDDSGVMPMTSITSQTHETGPDTNSHTAVMPTSMATGVDHLPKSRGGHDRRKQQRQQDRRSEKTSETPTNQGFKNPDRPHIKILVGLVVFVSLLIVVALFVNSYWGNDSATEPLGLNALGLDIATTTSYDPYGDQSEREQLSSLATDGDIDTHWQTETYKRSSLGGLKPGVGLAIGLNSAQSFEQIEIVTENIGWSAQIYIINARDFDRTKFDTELLAQPAGSIKNASGPASIPVSGEGDMIVLWVTETGKMEDEVKGSVYRFRLFEMSY